MKFSKREIFDLLKAWILISIAFTILYKGIISDSYALLFLASLLTAGLGFLLHELAHKFFAQKYNYYAEFKAFDFMLLFAILFSFFGFIIAVPGAVFIHGRITKKRAGIISLAGPLTNIMLGILFFVLLNLNFFTLVSDLGFRINSYLALFNMLPIFALDGKSVFRWNKMAYFIALIAALFLVFLQFV